MILACSKTYVEKRIPENRMQNGMWNSCLDFITKEIWCLNSPELNRLDYYVWNIRGQWQVSSKTEDIAELKKMLPITI